MSSFQLLLLTLSWRRGRAYRGAGDWRIDIHRSGWQCRGVASGPWAAADFRVMIRDFLAKHRRVIEQHSVEGQTVLVAHPLDLVSRIFEKRISMLLVGVHLQPVILRTYRDPPRLSHGGLSLRNRVGFCGVDTHCSIIW